MSKIAILIPVKELSEGKSRLSSILSVDKRQLLVMGILKRVIIASNASIANKVIVVGGGDKIKTQTEDMSAIWVNSQGYDLNSDFLKALNQLEQDGFSAAYLPADLPEISKEDINTILNFSATEEIFTFVPSSSDGGTNAMVIPKGLGFKPLLGKDSFNKHIDWVTKKGYKYKISKPKTLLRDLDTEEYLDYFEKLKPNFINNVIDEVRLV